MKRIITLAAALLVAGASFAQTDSTGTRTDTIKVGKFIIIKKQKDNDQNNERRSTTVTIERRKQKPSNISTNWWIFDLGFANVHDKTVYGSTAANNYLHALPGQQPFSEDDLKLRTGKTSNVNIWIFMQRLNVTKGVLNLKYGVGLEMFNYRYENNISYHKNPAYIFRDSVDFSKNKLYVGYVTVPFMLNVNTHPGHRGALSFSAGVSAGYRVGSHTKQISDERGKTKTRSDFDLEPFKLAYIGELGLGPVRLFGSYSMTRLHKNGLEQYPYSIGVRFSNW